MKIKLYGTGAINSKSHSCCTLIDQAILIDCPDHKVLLKDNVDLDKIQTLVITHLHGDHVFGIPALFFCLPSRETPLTIIAPTGATEFIKKLFEVTHFPQSVYERTNPTIIEVDKKHLKDGIEIGNYKIIPYKVQHVDYLECYGYTITRGGKTAGITGDAVLCEGVENIIKNSAIAFLDITGPAPAGANNVHMDIPEFEQLKNQYLDCKLVPVHMNDDTRKKLAKRGHKPPQDGKEYKI